MSDAQLAHVQLACVPSSILLERLLQTVRYRGFTVTNLSFHQLDTELAEIQFMVKGQAKLTTLQKSLEGLIEVQQCYLIEDKAKLKTLLEVGHYMRPNTNHPAQSITT